MSKSQTKEAQPKRGNLFPEPEALQLIPEVMARKYVTIPLAVNGNALQVAMANPADIFAPGGFGLPKSDAHRA